MVLFCDSFAVVYVYILQVCIASSLFRFVSASMIVCIYPLSQLVLVSSSCGERWGFNLNSNAGSYNLFH